MKIKLDAPHAVTMVGACVSIIGFANVFDVRFLAALYLCLLVLAYMEGAYWQGRWTMAARWVRSDFDSWRRDSGQRRYPRT